ncbi:MAG: cysteine synthase A [Christensenellaceae bacterium]|nr:cysteine synthase A [Christensenellaceae bacterium]
MNIYKSASQLIGHTPLLELCGYVKKRDIPARLVAKLESANPAGSAKDRVALAMILAAEEAGKLRPGDTIIEPTSGNTGIGLASVAAARGYKSIFTMPDTMSIERQLLLAAYGATIVLTPGEQGMAGAIAKAEQLAEELGGFIPGQFVNPANPMAHYNTTGPEIAADTDGLVDMLVAGVGTGGTLSGTGRYLKEQNPPVQVVAVEPAGSPVLSGGKAGPHGLMGIGAGFVPETMDTSVADATVQVTEEDAYAAAREVAATEGILVGISGGAALWAAEQMARKPENAGKLIVVILPDSGERYLSTPLYSHV